jgi:prepilin-type processing-associated H-X9-DG protein
MQSFHLTEQARSLGRMSERCDAALTHADATFSAYLGRAWISGRSATGGTYRHLKPPNKNHCHFGNSHTSGDFIITPGSNHTAGVNVVMADGHVQFVADDIAPRVWWAMGSRNGNDTANQ